MIDVKKIKNYTEKTWFLGTDILEESDLLLMDKEVSTSFCRKEGAIYNVDSFLHGDETSDQYSKSFRELIQEAEKRKYQWVFFDMDIETEIKA